MIEAVASDARATNEAGLRFIASLEGGLKQKSDFRGYKVDGFIHRFPEVVEAVRLLD